jgi:phytoene dehydrogenase-like protein
VSAAAHLLYALDPSVVRDFELERHGLQYARRSLKTVALAESGSAALVLDGANVVAGELGADDRAALTEYWRLMRRCAELLGKQFARVPPRMAWSGWREALPAGRLAWDLRKLGRADMREFLRIVTMCQYDVLEEHFADARLKGALAMDGVLGTKLGPRSGGTVLTALQRLAGGGAASGAIDLPRGGLGAVSEALAAAARAAGVEIRTGARVAAIETQGDRVAGVRLASGEVIATSVVVSNADPKTTLLKLLGARQLDIEFTRRLHHLRSVGTAAKLHLALDGLPKLAGAAREYLGERLLIAPSADYVDRAFNPSKYHASSVEPVLEISIPTLHDSSLAPAGQHVLSAVVQYAPHEVANGWQAERQPFLERTLSVLERYLPGTRQRIVATELLTPADLEHEFGMTGGHWHHAELAFDQYLMLRPVPGAGQYAMPVTGLYLCGAGAHPGGGVMGVAGRNAARVLLGEGA